jgi:endonuclease/exonuclease/phosphatase (EEP) superfamily protein YafD
MHVVRWATEWLAWGVIVVTVAVLVTQAVGWCGSRFVAVGQALTVVLGGLGVLAVICGWAWSDRPMTIAALAVVAGSLVVILPAVRRPAAPGTGSRLTVFHANLLFENTRRPAALAAAVLGVDADILALSELHPAHAAALLADPGADRYPHRFDRTATNADGMAVWSRYPLADVEWVAMEVRPAVIATVCLPGGDAVRLVLAHPNPPTTRRGLRHWEPSMDAIHEAASAPGPPTIIVADLNAARWHPPLRRLLARGWRDVHEAAGRGLSVSWPTAGLWPIPFVRLDHALVGDGLDVVAVRDLPVPGSDHRGFVATVAVTRRPDR